MENHENSNVTSYTQPKLSEQQRMEQLRLQQQLTFGETPQQKAKRADIFSVMMVPTLVYAMLYTFLLYDNFHSITLPLFVVVTIGYCGYVLARFRGCAMRQLHVKPMSVFCMAGMLALAVSTCMTGNWSVSMMNHAGIFVLLICMLLFEVCDTGNWTLAKGVSAVVTAVFGAIGCLAEPFSDFSCFRKLRTKHHMTKTVYVLIGVICAVPILGIVIALLYQADAVFAHALSGMFSFDVPVSRVAGIVFTFAYALLAAYCGIRYLGKGTISTKSKDLRKLEPMIANTVLVLISVVYVLFCIIQIFSLFLGKMQLPAGYTYARYAREGFFQLLFVCMINVCLVLFFMGCFRENGLKKILLTVISGCTYVMIASSAFRMCLYIQNYRLTFLRVFVLWMLVLIGVLLGGIVAQIYRQTFPLFRYMIVVVTIAVFAFGIVRPDYWIAKYDITHMPQRENESLLPYLSTDAAPVIAGHHGQWVKEYVNGIEYDMESNHGVRSYNFSYAKAQELFQNAQ